MNNIIELLKIEWIKLCGYRAFKILLGLFVISIFGINFVMHEGMSVATSGNSPRELNMLIGSPFEFPSIWHTVSYLSSFLLFLPGLIIILFMGNEYSFRTVRQNIIDGVSRRQFILTKIAIIFLISIVLTVLVFIVALLFGLLEGGNSFTFVNTEYLFFFFVQSIMYMSVALLIVLLFKRSGISIGIYFLYAFILEEILVALLNNYIRPVGYFLPLESSDKLISNPLAVVRSFGPQSPDTVYFILASFAWISLCLFFCKYKFEKDDL